MPGSEKRAVSASASSQWLQIAVVLLPVAAVYAILLREFTSVPIIDDYWHVLAFALDFHRTPGLLHKILLVFTTQVGPYRLIFEHGFVAVQMLLFGHVNFRTMAWIGNLFPLGTLALLWKNTPRPAAKYGLLLLLPVTLLFFTLNYAELWDWAQTGLQWNAVVFFSLASLHWLVRSRESAGRFALACAAGVLACCCSSNGAPVWPVGLVYLLAQDRRWTRLLAWCVCCVAIVTVVFLYHHQPNGVNLHAPLAQEALFFVSFCGGVMENMHHRPVPYISLVIGAAILVTVAAAIRSRYDLRQPFFFCMMLWAIMTAMLAANARVAMGFQLSLSSRYKIYADLLLVFCYQFALDRQLKKPAEQQNLRRFGAAAILTALAVCVGGDLAGAKFLATRKQRAETAMRAYLASPESASPLFLVEDTLSPQELQEEDLARRELNEATRAGIYTPPPPSRFGLF